MSVPMLAMVGTVRKGCAPLPPVLTRPVMPIHHNMAVVNAHRITTEYGAPGSGAFLCLRCRCAVGNGQRRPCRCPMMMVPMVARTGTVRNIAPPPPVVMVPTMPIHQSMAAVNAAKRARSVRLSDPAELTAFRWVISLALRPPWLAGSPAGRIQRCCSQWRYER